MAHPYSRTAWVDGTSPPISAANLNKIEAQLLASDNVANLALEYGVITTNSESTNGGLIATALADATSASGGGFGLYLPGTTKPYPCSTITLPSEPVHFFGDGPMVSVLGTTGGTILTYNNTVAALSGATDPWSRNNPSATAGQHYKPKQWSIHDLGFTKTDNWTNASGNGWDFPAWAGTVDGNDRLTMWAQNIVVSNFNAGSINTNAGILYLINGCWNDSFFHNVVAFSNKGKGVIWGSDCRWSNSLAMNNGEEGFWSSGKAVMATNIKSYANGTLNPTGTLTAGFYVEGTMAGYLLSNCYAQDNNGPGLWIHNATRVTIENFTTDRDCWNGNVLNTAKQFGVLIDDSTEVEITGLNGTDSYTGARNNHETHLIKVTNTSGTTNFGNKITGRFSPFAGSSATLLDPVDPTSDLNGTDVIIGGSGGGIRAVAYAATVTPDPYAAQTCQIGALTGGVTVAAPSNRHLGCRLTVKFLEDGTGGRNVTWNGIYVFQTAWTNSGNTSGKRSQATFQYDGTSWISVDHGVNVWY